MFSAIEALLPTFTYIDCFDTTISIQYMDVWQSLGSIQQSFLTDNFSFNALLTINVIIASNPSELYHYPLYKTLHCIYIACKGQTKSKARNSTTSWNYQSDIIILIYIPIYIPITYLLPTHGFTVIVPCDVCPGTARF